MKNMKKTIAAIAAIVFCTMFFSPEHAKGADESYRMDPKDIGYTVGIVAALSLFLFPRLKTKEPMEEKKPSNEEPAKTETSITSGMDISESGGKPVLYYAVRMEF